MPRPQFTLRALLVAVSLVAIGLGLASTHSHSLFGIWVRSIGSWACWGAAIGVFFDRAKRGAVIGALLILPLVVFVSMLPTD